MRAAALILTLACLAGCASAVTGPPGQPSRTDVNPETGARGGTSSGSSAR